MRLFPHSGTLRQAQDDAAQWRPHEACTELAEVKTVSEFGDLAVQVNELEAQFEALSDEALRVRANI